MTFKEALLRLIKEEGKNPSALYKYIRKVERANLELSNEALYDVYEAKYHGRNSSGIHEIRKHIGNHVKDSMKSGDKVTLKGEKNRYRYYCPTLASSVRLSKGRASLDRIIAINNIKVRPKNAWYFKE